VEDRDRTPPGQVRTFDGYVGLYNMPAPMAQQWFYRVTELEAKRMPETDQRTG
jgi:hypothetical protein